MKNKHSSTLWIGVVMLGILVALALLAPVICPYDPLEQNLYDYLQAPGKAHLLGTDQLGRDFFARLIYAARTDLFVMATAEIIPFTTGIFVGMVAGYFGGIPEWIITLLTDTLTAFPFYLLVIVVAFVTGAGVHGIYITFILVGWITYAKVVRGMTASMRGQEWVMSARIMGYPDWKILAQQIFPNVLPQAIILLMSDMVGLLVVIVTLGYLGIGIAAPTPDWGTMISEGQTFISTEWRLSVLPGLMVVYTGIALSMIGDGLADRWRQDGF